jgi:hypothetical protein
MLPLAPVERKGKAKRQGAAAPRRRTLETVANAHECLPSLSGEQALSIFGRHGPIAGILGNE